VHCYTESHPQKYENDLLARDDYIRIMEEARSVECRKIQFIGGEPQLNRDLPYLVRAALELKFEFIEVFSNLTRLTNDLLELAVNHSINFATSIYSSDPSKHDNITRLANSHARTVANIKRLLELRVGIRVGTIDVAEDGAGLSRTESFLREIGVGQISIDRVRGVGRGKNHEGQKRNIDELCGACWDKKLCVAADGAAYPCIMSRDFKVGNVRTEPLAEILNASALRLARKEIFERTSFSRMCSPDCVPGHFGPSCAPSSGPTCAPYRPNSATVLRPVR
jgi:radical SAM protein with 4Fe4S-binding SPASM domain